MKKLVYLLGFCVILFSCTHELEVIDPVENEDAGNIENVVLPNNIPASFIANLSEDHSNPATRTIYEDSKSKWVLGDRVCLLYVDKLAAPDNQGWIAYSVTAVADEGKTATFTIVDGQADKITALSSYVSTGVAIYPSNAARPYTANTEAIDEAFGHKPFITIQTTQTGNFADVVMLGKTAVVDGDNMTVSFKTAMSILKVEVTGIPSEAAKFQLYSSDADVYPTGDFLIDINAEAPLELTKNSYHTGSGDTHSGSQSITINRTDDWDDGSQVFYLNVPTGAYNAETITLKLLDDRDNLLMEKPIKTDFTFVRNKMITGISLATEWTTLGTGKFIDNHMWGKMGFGTNTFEEVGNVNVQFYQNVSDHTKYRLANPYGQAASFLAAEGQSQGDHDDYLEFTVPAEGNVTFINHKTGYTYSNQIISIQHIDSEKNTVTVGTRAEPKIVQLAPIYKGTGNFQESRNGCANKIQIIFPSAVDAYGGTLSIINNKADLSDGLSCAKGASVGTLCIFISDVPIYDFLSGASTTNAIGSGPGSRKSNPASTFAANELGFGVKNYGDKSKQSQSGVKYLTWSTWNNNNGDILYQIGCKKFYGIVPSQATKLLGTYTFTSPHGLFHYYGHAWIPLSGTDANSLVLAVSDDPTKGNVKLTKFFGFGCDGTTSSYIVNHEEDGDNWEDGKNGDQNVASDLTGTFGSGTAAYGKFIGYTTNTLTFTDSEQSPFMTYTGTHNGTNKTWDLYVGARVSTDQTTRDSQFGFNFTSDETTASLTVNPNSFLILHFDGSPNANRQNCVLFINGQNSNTYSSIIATKPLE